MKNREYSNPKLSWMLLISNLRFGRAPPGLEKRKVEVQRKKNVIITTIFI